MEQRFVSAYNESSKRFLGSSLAVVDSAREPIKVLKILMEGLAPEDEAGLWLTNFRGVPVARSHTPFDLAYLDEDDRIIQAVEITQNSRFVPFKGNPASALILPPRALSASGTFTGDHILFRDVQISDSDRPQPHPQAGAGIFSRIVRATMVKNFNVPDEQAAAAAPRSGPLMRSARSLSIKPPKATQDELEHDRLAARVAAATAVTPAAMPPSVQWKPAPSLRPPAAPQENAPPPPSFPEPVAAPANEPERRPEPERDPEIAAQFPSVAEELPSPAPAAVPLELESTWDDFAAEPERACGSASDDLATEAAAPPEFSTHHEAPAPEFFPEAPAPPEETHPTFAESFAPVREALGPFTAHQTFDAEETEELPAALESTQPEPEVSTPSHAAFEEPAEPIKPPSAAEPEKPAFDIEAFRRLASFLPSAPIETAKTESITPPSPAIESTPGPRHSEEPSDDLPAPVYAWSEPSIAAPLRESPPPSESPSSHAHDAEPEEDPVSRDVAILISSNVAIAAALPFVVLASPQSILYNSQIETPREDEDEELEKRELGESLYLRTVERKSISPPVELAPRAKWEPDFLKRALATETESKTPAAPEPQRTVPSAQRENQSTSAAGSRIPSTEPSAARPARIPAPPERTIAPSPAEPPRPSRPTPGPSASAQPAPATPPAASVGRESAPVTPREVSRVARPVPAPAAPPPSRRPRFVEPDVPPPSAAASEPTTALVSDPSPTAPSRPHTAPISPESSHVVMQAPSRPTPPPPASVTKMAKRWDVKLLYSLFPDIRPDYRPDLEQPVVNFNKDVGRTHEETQTRRMKVLNWIYPDLHLDTVKKRQREVRRAPRIPVPGLVGYFFTGGKSEAHEILNISVMGFYMKTTQRWMPGTVIRVTLQMIDSDGTNPSDSITVLSRVVNWDNDGGGFEFVLPGLID